MNLGVLTPNVVNTKPHMFVEMGLGTGAGITVGLLGLGALALERQYRRRPSNRLVMTAGKWEFLVPDPEHYRLVGRLDLCNLTRSLEIMVPKVTAQVQLFSQDSLQGITWKAQVKPCHPGTLARADGYWFAYIVKAGKTTYLEVTVDIQGPQLALEALKTAWIRIHYLTYGPGGQIPKVRHVMVPLQFPTTTTAPNWRSTSVAAVLPVRTHLLSHLDDPVTVVKRYVAPHAQPGDIVTLGETPVAIMQERWRHPSEVRPGWLARRLCYFFLPTSSLATACGLQSLVDIVGPIRVGLAFLGGAIARLVLRQHGVFYQLAGEQARLIDDVTGTLPPYDQFIILGPEHPEKVVEEIQRKTGLAAAIVDVNDLKAVKVLAASPQASIPLLEQALRDNPAGNADEQTPLVLIRPHNS